MTVVVTMYMIKMMMYMADYYLNTLLLLSSLIFMTESENWLES